MPDNVINKNNGLRPYATTAKYQDMMRRAPAHHVASHRVKQGGKKPYNYPDYQSMMHGFSPVSPKSPAESPPRTDWYPLVQPGAQLVWRSIFGISMWRTTTRGRGHTLWDGKRYNISFGGIFSEEKFRARNWAAGFRPLAFKIDYDYSHSVDTGEGYTDSSLFLETFTGDDGDPPDAENWSEYTGDQDDAPCSTGNTISGDIQSNTFYGDIHSVADNPDGCFLIAEKYIQHTSDYSGDVYAEVDLHLDSAPTIGDAGVYADQWWCQMWLHFADDDYSLVLMRGYVWNDTYTRKHYLRAFKTSSGGAYAGTEIISDETDLDGYTDLKLRIERIDSTFTFKYYHDGSWNTMGTWEGSDCDLSWGRLRFYVTCDNFADGVYGGGPHDPREIHLQGYYDNFDVGNLVAAGADLATPHIDMKLKDVGHRSMAIRPFYRSGMVIPIDHHNSDIGSLTIKYDGRLTLKNIQFLVEEKSAINPKAL